ncbi:hypothetical protein Tco_1532786 [Tanacetum coccineum]
MGLPNSPPKDGIIKSKPFLEGNYIDPQDSERHKQLSDMGFPTITSFDQSWVGSKYQVDSPLDLRSQNKGKTSSEVEPDFNPHSIQFLGDFQALMGNSDDEFKGFTLDAWNRHEKAVTSYDDLRTAVEQAVTSRLAREGKNH